MIVANPEDYFFSSARDYADTESLLEVVTIDSRLITYSSVKVWRTECILARAERLRVYGEALMERSGINSCLLD